MFVFYFAYGADSLLKKAQINQNTNCEFEFGRDLLLMTWEDVNNWEDWKVP